jgi:hypothetical protein
MRKLKARKILGSSSAIRIDAGMELSFADWLAVRTDLTRGLPKKRSPLVFAQQASHYRASSDWEV